VLVVLVVVVMMVAGNAGTQASKQVKDSTDTMYSRRDGGYEVVYVGVAAKRWAVFLLALAAAVAG
jgi:hypothetical protein